MVSEVQPMPDRPGTERRGPDRPVEPTAPPTLSVTPDRLACAFRSDPAHLAAVRRAAEAFCATTPLDAAARNELGLVVNEAIANVIRHAYHGATDQPIELTVERHGTGVRVTLRDWGNGVIPDPSHNPACADPLLPGGLGLICLRSLTDDARFEPQPDGGMKLVLTRTTPGRRRPSP
jgi:serine/threonine-protein kinase RsbW